MLHPLARLASTNVLEYKLILAGLVKVTTYGKVGLFPITMIACWSIVTLIHDAQAQIVMRGDDDARSEADNVCLVQQPVASLIPIR